MKNCSRHSADLRTALERKGLWPLCNPANAKDNAIKWLTGVTNLGRGEFDPYVVATLEINKKFIEYAGELHPDDCPLCHVPKILAKSGADAVWIDNVTDMLVIFAKVNNLIK